MWPKPARSRRRSAIRSSSRPRRAAAGRGCGSAGRPPRSRNSTRSLCEARAAFGDPSLYREKYISGARHIEIQVIGDNRGKVIAFAERECSVQRRYQKLIEETPSPFLDERVRRKMMKDVEEAAVEVGYQSLGTFEFLVDDKRHYYFMEANARVQVEHPITEMIYGINLVKAQLRAAAGEKITFPFELQFRGHSIECRINAEDPETFVPSPGRLDFLVLPGGRGSAWIRRLTAAGRFRPTMTRS
jgi:acetyl-CoA carboxylase biotin carboxylase subunit